MNDLERIEEGLLKECAPDLANAVDELWQMGVSRKTILERAKQSSATRLIIGLVEAHIDALERRAVK